jgi:hypothetical protein
MLGRADAPSDETEIGRQDYRRSAPTLQFRKLGLGWHQIGNASPRVHARKGHSPLCAAHRQILLNALDRSVRRSSGGGETQDIQHRGRRPKWGKHKAHMASVTRHFRVMAQKRNTGVIGIHQRKQGRHDTKDKV